MVHAERPTTPVDKSRKLQRKLYLAAKRSRNRRFHALYDRIFRPDVLWRAWEEVRRNLDSTKRAGVLLPNRDMRGKTLKAARRRLSESRMRENRSAELTAKPHVRFEVAGNGNQDTVLVIEALSRGNGEKRAAAPKSQAPSPDPTSGWFDCGLKVRAHHRLRM